MKLLIKVLVTLIVTMTVAEASCPPTMPYGCRQMPNGKMSCGCGQG